MTRPAPAQPRSDSRTATGAGSRTETHAGRTVRLWRAGRVEYGSAFAWQRATAEAVAAGRAAEAVALLEHPPVYTFGVRGKREHLLATPEALAARGAEIVDTDRGGDVTFHGPGQLVAYPILDVRGRKLGAGGYVRRLEAAVVATLEAFGVRGERVAGRPGVWVGGEKIAALGVRISRGVSRHGLALNVSTDLEWFDLIVPCGIVDAGVTSLERALGVAPEMRAVEDAFARAFEQAFEIELVEHIEKREPELAAGEAAGRDD